MSQTVKHTPAEPSAVIRPLVAVPDLTDWELVSAQWERSLKARRLAPRTIKRYLESYAPLADWAVGRGCVSPEEVDLDLLEAYFEHLSTRLTSRGRPASDAYVAIEYRHLRVFFNWLAGKDDVPSPMAKLAAPQVRAKPVPIFSDEQLVALVRACAGRDFVSRRDAAIIRVLLDAGLRRGELAALTVADVDQPRQRFNANGKTGQRWAPYGAKTAEALDDYLRVRNRHPDRLTDALWLADPARGGGPLGSDGVRQMLGRRATAAGVPGVFAHKFRHTAVHAFRVAGGSEGDAMENFGWSSRAMLDRYGKSAASERAQESARRLSVGDRI